ncbi:hypothetical protein ACHQM5_002659 [Ranunculus cassubicifolius]
METPQQHQQALALSVESFSFKWVINLKHSFDGLGDSFRSSLEASDHTSFIDMDPTWRKRSLGGEGDFNFPSSSSMLVHADEVFSKGLLMPFLFTPSSTDNGITTFAEVLKKSSASRRSSFLLKCWKSWRRALKKHLCFLGPSFGKVQDSCNSSSAEIMIDNTQCEETISRRTSTTNTDYITYDWSDIEKSIQEAVLHCKRSFEKSKDSNGESLLS